MEKLHKILTDLEQGKISSDHAEQQVLDLFAISVSFEHGEKLCDCPECGAEIVYGLSKETMMIINNNRLFKRK
jgi:NCAIR mutase (PurE)-related protein